MQNYVELVAYAHLILFLHISYFINLLKIKSFKTDYDLRNRYYNEIVLLGKCCGRKHIHLYHGNWIQGWRYATYNVER